MTTKRFNVAAIIYDKRGNVLSIGNNSYVKTHPLQAKYAKQVGEPYKQVLHAEIHAITRCANLDKAYKIAVFRFKEDGTPAMAKPCKICAQAIAATNIKIVEHT